MSAPSDFEFGDEICRPAFDGREIPKISYGLRFPETTLRHCRDTFGVSHVYVLCSKTLAEKTDALNRLRSSLGSRVAGVQVGISPHTPIAEVLKIVADARLRDIDCIVTLGAGSLTDASKLVRLALENDATTEEDMNTLWGTPQSNPLLRRHIRKPSIPLIHIPTSLSGGEYQAIAGGTDTKDHAKHTFHCEQADPELVIQDPELCLTTPQNLWLSTGIRAVDHCVETLCSLVSNDKGDECSKKGLPKLISGLIASKEDPSSLSARHLCQTGTVEAMAAVSSGVPLGGSHAIGHQLGPLGVGHGETSCILLPAVCRYNILNNANNERQAVVKECLLQQTEVQHILGSRSIDASQADLGMILHAIISYLGMPRTLEEVGVGEDKFPNLAKNSLDDIWIKTNAVPITTESQVREILAMCTRQTVW